MTCLMVTSNVCVSACMRVGGGRGMCTYVLVGGGWGLGRHERNRRVYIITSWKVSMG